MNKLIYTTAMLVISFSALQAQALKLNLKPGLWKLDTKITGDVGFAGKDFQENMQKMYQESQKEMEKMMASLPPEQRKQIEGLMKQQAGGSMSPFEAEVCWTADDFDVEAQLKRQNFSKDDSCKTDITKKSAKLIQFNFSCDDGVKGSGEHKILSDKKTETRVNFTRGKEKGSIVNVANFVKADCGDVKPLKK